MVKSVEFISRDHLKGQSRTSTALFCLATKKGCTQPEHELPYGMQSEEKCMYTDERNEGNIVPGTALELLPLQTGAVEPSHSFLRVTGAPLLQQSPQLS